MMTLLFGLWLMILCLPAVGAEESSPTLTVRRGDGMDEIGIYCNLHSLTGEDPLVLLLEVEIPPGWQLGEVRAGEGAEGLILTYGDRGEGIIRILLDGVISGEGDRPILWLNVEKHPDFAHDTGVYIGVTGKNRGELILYVQRNKEIMEEIPLTVVWDGWEEDVTESVTEDPLPEETGDTESELEPETTVQEIPARVADFLGCRETEAVEGVYGVQFLFSREGIVPGIFCAEGGGLLFSECETVEEVKAGESLHGCTMWGLMENRRYVFWILSEDGWITVTYEGGKFCGFGKAGLCG